MNKLSLNVSKSKSLLFSRNRNMVNERIIIRVGDQQLEQQDVYKYLGLYLDNRLNFDKHVEYLCNNVKQKLGTLGKIRKYLDQGTSLMLYKSLILPVIDYGDIVYMTTSQNNLGKVQKLQNSACRIILRAERRTSTKYMHDQLELLELAPRRRYHLDTQVYKCMNNMVPQYISNMFENIELRHGVNTRSAANNVLVIPHTRTLAGESAFTVRAPLSWNRLPEDVKKAETLESLYCI